MQIAPASTTPSTPVARSAQQQLGKDDFLRLLTTQLANQNPLSPMDNGAFIAQLAQFSSVEQLHGVAERLDGLLAAQASSNHLAAASLVGREIAFRSDVVEAGAGAPAAIRAELPADAVLSVTLFDAAGVPVRTMDLGPRPAGALEVAWDGRDDGGNPVPPGAYRARFAATSPAGEPLAVEPRGRGRVAAVALEPDGPVLVVGAARVKLPEVLQITQG
jgi:flagellar basal-body rod modification protein FlgD